MAVPPVNIADMVKEFHRSQGRAKAYNASATNIDCARCMLSPSMVLLPCKHIVCYEHYLSKDLEAAKTTCAECGEEVEAFVGLKQDDPLTALSTLFDRLPRPLGPRDSNTNWPSTSLQGNTTRGGHGHALNFSNTKDGFPMLPSTGNDFFTFPPRSRGAHSQNFAQQQRDSAPAPSNRGAQFHGSSRLDPSAPIYHPPQRRPQMDPIIRPESTSSNGTFATQLAHNLPPRIPMPPRSTPNGRPPYVDPSQNGQRQISSGFNGALNNLGADLSDLRLSSGRIPRPLPVVNEDSNRGSGSSSRGNANGRQSQSFGSSQPSAKTKSSAMIAQEIIAGMADVPNDKRLKKLDAPVKNPAPTLGPARFKNTKMFSTTDGSNLDVAVAETPVIRRPSGPPSIPLWLDLATQGLCQPTLDEAFDALPFADLCRNVFPSNAGVVRIKDIPYQTTRQEMTAFVGRNAQINRQPEGSPYHAVHIMMERETGKTMDCFVEFSTPSEAAWVTRQFAKRVEENRPPKVGDRVVEVVCSSQDELMSELFPRAKHVCFRGGQPVVDDTPRKYYNGQSAAGFQGFMHPEEFVMLAKHAGLNDKSPFASKSPCRVYEAMITTLYKYPWYDVEHITVKERRAIYDCTHTLMGLLVDNLRKSNTRATPLEPTSALLRELVVATLTCPGFSERQKCTIVTKLNNNGHKSLTDGRSINVSFGGTHEFSAVWPFAALSIIPGVDNKLVKFFARLFSKATSGASSGSLASRKAAEAAGRAGNPMGEFNTDYGNHPESLTIADIARKEYNQIEKLLCAVLRKDYSGQSGGSAHGSVYKGSRDGRSGPSSNGSATRSY